MGLDPGTPPWLIHRVGAGARSAHDLTEAEAEAAAAALLRGDWTPAQEGAFLLALRVKGESEAETAGIVRAVRAANVPLEGIPEGVVDVPAHAGKSKTFHALAGGGILAAASGVRLLLHGDRDAPRGGLAPVLEALGLPCDPSPAETARLLRAHGWGYLDVSRFNPPLHRLLLLRSEMGVRSVFHAAAKASNPSGAKSHFVGVSHAPYFRRQAGVLLALGARRALVFRGSEGESEVSLTGATPVYRAGEGDPIEETWSPERLGLRRVEPGEVAAGDPREEAGWTREALGGKAGPRRDTILLTAAALRVAAGLADSLEQALEETRRTLDRRAPLTLLETIASPT